ncbi:hypothetical protein CRG98_017672 [Punica granatum]|uniref:Uncharacterized protein n=1 Tax=Punica granatum TaxID=22663 RepID=A0A2I0K2M3_PUNGR|nr:hypothetical protein CRG98_017672 [Punica granatum]
MEVLKMVLLRHGNLCSSGGLVYILENVGWGWSLRILTILMFLSVVALVFGYPVYRKMEPTGSPFTQLLQVSVAAF